MEFIGENNITDALNTWLDKWGFTARVAGFEDAFAWNPCRDLIYYTFVIPEKQVALFNAYTYELGLKYEIDDFWMAFLHELGHSETWHLLDEEDWDEPDDITDFEYYRLPRETIATEWAVQFINKHSDLVVELTQLVAPILQQFFALNDIVLEEAA